MKTVVATDRSSCLGVNLRELGRIAQKGEIFECTDDRFLVLSGHNKYNAVFVLERKEPKVVEPVVEEVVVEEPVVEEVVLEEPVEEEVKTTKKKSTKKKATEETAAE